MRRVTITPTRQPSIPGATAPTAATLPRERLDILDVFRGIAVAGMLLVSFPGRWSDTFAPLRPAGGIGWTPTDLLCPIFLVLVGVSAHLSLGWRRACGTTEAALVRRILIRGVALVLIGVLVSAFPFFPASRWGTLSISAVLPRIGIAYVAGALLTLRARAVSRATVAAGLLIGYWLLVMVVPVPGELGAPNLPSSLAREYVDPMVLGGWLWTGAQGFSRAGILSILPAIATVVLGTLAGEWIDSVRPLADRINGLFAVGAVGTVLGLVWNWAFPFDTQLWSSSFVVLTAGVAGLSFATCAWVIEVQRIRGWTRPFLILGTNPLVTFVSSMVVARAIYALITVERGGARIPLQAVLYEMIYASWLPPRFASLLFAVTLVLLWIVILRVLQRRGIAIAV